MTSETPDMTWTVTNILPGEKDETTLTVKNIGPKKVNVDLKAQIELGEDLTKVLDIQIIRQQASKGEDEVLYSGKYSDLKSVNVDVNPNETALYKFIISLPVDTGNEYQQKECVVKLYLTATGIEDEKPTPIHTDEVQPPQTGEGIILYIVAGILVVAFLVFLITFFINKKDNNN